MERRLSGTKAMPARQASAVLRGLKDLPPIDMVPASARSLPNSVRASSIRPQPMKP